MFLRGGDRALVRIARDEIEELLPSGISIMPNGFEQELSLQQISDLLAYLLAQKANKQ